MSNFSTKSQQPVKLPRRTFKLQAAKVSIAGQGNLPLHI